MLSMHVAPLGFCSSLLLFYFLIPPSAILAQAHVVHGPITPCAPSPHEHFGRLRRNVEGGALGDPSLSRLEMYPPHHCVRQCHHQIHIVQTPETLSANPVESPDDAASFLTLCSPVPIFCNPPIVVFPGTRMTIFIFAPHDHSTLLRQTSNLPNRHGHL